VSGFVIALRSRHAAVGFVMGTSASAIVLALIVIAVALIATRFRPPA
jgi:hypothetical protein